MSESDLDMMFDRAIGFGNQPPSDGPEPEVSPPPTEPAGKYRSRLLRTRGATLRWFLARPATGVVAVAALAGLVVPQLLIEPTPSIEVAHVLDDLTIPIPTVPEIELPETSTSTTTTTTSTTTTSAPTTTAPPQTSPPVTSPPQTNPPPQTAPPPPPQTNPPPPANATASVKVHCTSPATVTFTANGGGTTSMTVSGPSSGSDTGSPAVVTVSGGAGTYSANATSPGWAGINVEMSTSDCARVS